MINNRVEDMLGVSRSMVIFGSKSHIETEVRRNGIVMIRLLLSPDQDIVIAEPEVEIYPLSKGMG